MDSVPFFIFFSIVALILFMSFSKRGRGTILGGKIKWSGRYILIAKHKFTFRESRLQVHTTKISDREPAKIGIEIRHRSIVGFSIYPISLSLEQAKAIADDLNEAIEHADT